MKEYLFRLAVSTAVNFLALAIKDPTSATARRARRIVEELHTATGNFLRLVPQLD